MIIDKNKTCALFVDYQERLIPAMNRGSEFVETSAKLASGLIALNIPIVCSEQYPKGLGSTVSDLKDIEGFPLGIAKSSFSCMLEENLVSAIKETGAKNVILVGCETHVCVLQTAIDLLDIGYSVYLPVDCCTSRTEANHNVGIKRMEQEGVFVTSFESILFELLRTSGGDAFKTISNLVK